MKPAPAMSKHQQPEQNRGDLRRIVGIAAVRQFVFALPSVLLACLFLTSKPAAMAGEATETASGSRGEQPLESLKPNVIVILTDDQGAVDAGCYGAEDLATPAIDTLAAHGVRFTQFYATAPVCSPSRAGLLTGRYPLRAGVPDNCASQRGQHGALPANEVTIAETFKAAGYATAHIGKWHLGYTPDTMPNSQGFDYSFGHMGGCIDNWSHFFYWSGANVHDLHRNAVEVFANGRFFGDLMLEEAAQFMAANRDRPFFIYFAMNEPHYPYQPDVKWQERFKKLRYPRNLYAAFIATMDERIGALLRRVDELGLRERTIVVFQSDNGHSTEERAHFGGGSAGPYRGAKFSLLDFPIPGSPQSTKHRAPTNSSSLLGPFSDRIPKESSQLSRKPALEAWSSSGKSSGRQRRFHGTKSKRMAGESLIGLGRIRQTSIVVDSKRPGVRNEYSSPFCYRNQWPVAGFMDKSCSGSKFRTEALYPRRRRQSIRSERLEFADIGTKCRGFWLFRVEGNVCNLNLTYVRHKSDDSGGAVDPRP